MVNNFLEFNVDLGETDAAGLVYYPNYFRWFDRATRTYLHITGVTPKDMLGKFHFDQPVIDCGCKFYAPLRYDDPLKIKSFVTEVTEKTFRIEHKVFSGDNLVAVGYEIRTWVEIDNPLDGGSLNTVDIPGFFAEKLLEGRPEARVEQDETTFYLNLVN